MTGATGVAGGVRGVSGVKVALRLDTGVAQVATGIAQLGVGPKGAIIGTELEDGELATFSHIVLSLRKSNGSGSSV